MSDTPVHDELARDLGPQPRTFTTEDGSTYRGVPADEFEDFSDVDHTAVDPATGQVTT